jgi:hypothetical protein
LIRCENRSYFLFFILQQPLWEHNNFLLFSSTAKGRMELAKAIELVNGSVPEKRLRIKIVKNIPEVAINHEEAYKLRVTNDSVLIEAFI